jgi:hypothetical protein
MADKIMVVRHAEKPDKADDVSGVDPEGDKSKNDLSPRGWQRSGALVRFFNPLDGRFTSPELAKPNAIFAAAPWKHIKSERSIHTVEALAQSLKLKVNLDFTKGDEKKVVDAANSTRGVVLIGWEHNAIIDLANLIVGDAKTCPQKWPDDRFDLVWIFDKKPVADLRAASAWKFTQVTQQVLPGDSPKPI